MRHERTVILRFMAYDSAPSFEDREFPSLYERPFFYFVPLPPPLTGRYLLSCAEKLGWKINITYHTTLVMFPAGVRKGVLSVFVVA